jgi:hypothetical protein
MSGRTLQPFTANLTRQAVVGGAGSTDPGPRLRLADWRTMQSEVAALNSR